MRKGLVSDAGVAPCVHDPGHPDGRVHAGCWRCAMNGADKIRRRRCGHVVRACLEKYAEDVAVGLTPSILTTRARLHVGHPRALVRYAPILQVSAAADS